LYISQESWGGNTKFEFSMYTLIVYVKIISAVNTYLMKGYRFLVLAMMLSMIYEVISRYAFNSPTIWAYEFTGMLVGPFLIFSACWSMVKVEHVRLGIFYDRLTPRVQGIIDMITWTLFWFYVGLVLYYGWNAFLFSFSNKSVSKSLWAPLLWPWKLTVPVGCAFLLLQGVAVYANAIVKAITGVPLNMRSTQDKSK